MSPTSYQTAPPRGGPTTIAEASSECPSNTDGRRRLVVGRGADMADEARLAGAGERQAQWEARLELWAVVCAGVFGAVAILSLLGWWLRENALSQPFPGERATPPNSALALLLGSLAVAFVVRRRGQNRGVTTIAAIGVLLIGIATFLEHVLH